MIKKYALQIQEELKVLKLQAFHNKKEDLVYALNESLFGDIYCLYQKKGNTIISFALFQPEVKFCDMEKVISFLDALNKESIGGFFYLDTILHRVVYCVDYDLSRGTDISGFRLFCTHAYEQMKNHRQVLYWLITGHIAKGIDSEIAASMV